MICYITGNFEAGNSLNFAVTFVVALVSQYLQVRVQVLPSDVIDFAMLATQGFWREIVSLIDVM